MGVKRKPYDLHFPSQILSKPVLLTGLTSGNRQFFELLKRLATRKASWSGAASSPAALLEQLRAGRANVESLAHMLPLWGEGGGVTSQNRGWAWLLVGP